MRIKLQSVILIIAFIAITALPVSAQRHFYNRVELGAGNVYSFVGTTAISIIANQLAHRPITESSLRFVIPCSEYGNLNSFQGFNDFNYDRFNSEQEEYNGYIKFGGRDLLSNISVGDKMGYISDNLGSVNYCIYGAAYYNLLQFRLMQTADDYTPISTQRLQLGAGAMLTLGSIESNDRFIIDAGVRYNLPIGFSGVDGTVGEMMNRGVSSHYMLKYSYKSQIAAGLTIDVMHYNMFKDTSLCGDQSKVFEFGIVLSLLFQ